MFHYLNNAGAGLMSQNTLHIITDFYEKELAEGAYQAAQNSKALMEDFYVQSAKLINAPGANDIAFTDSASRGWNLAIYGAKLNPGDTIVTLASEFGTNLLTLFDYAKKHKCKVDVVECDIQGDFDLFEIKKALENGAQMIALSHAAAHGSIINPVIEIGQLAKQYGALFVVDGCQALGQLDVNLKDLYCDAYIATGRKWLLGPRGTGFLYAKPSPRLQSPQLDLASADLVFDEDNNVVDVSVRNDARQFELWERNVAGMLGFSNAIKECITKGIFAISEKISSYADRLRSCVMQNDNLILIGKQNSSSGVVGFYCKDMAREGFVQKAFDENSVRISIMKDWDCPLHFPKNIANSIFRLSPHVYTSEETILSACNILMSL